MAADTHGNFFRYASTNHVPDCGSAEIVEEPAGTSCHLAGTRPRLAKINDRISAIVEDQSRERDSSIRLYFSYYLAPFDEFRQLSVQRDAAGFTVFGILRPQP